VRGVKYSTKNFPTVVKYSTKNFPHVRRVKYSTKNFETRPHRCHYCQKIHHELALEAHLADYTVSGPWKELHYEFVQVDRTTGRSVLTDNFDASKVKTVHPILIVPCLSRQSPIPVGDYRAPKALRKP
jgi:hypothetical protein